LEKRRVPVSSTVNDLILHHQYGWSVQPIQGIARFRDKHPAIAQQNGISSLAIS
jgi:hypothetical protein